ncbi:phosphoribosylanthranilate isomerase [Hydrogenovibrio sp. 3SP14C1]|uniref:phosphoribosylanthranilate isomerase n=1 Tax=Hydrogenovibrio sp. 3SP14C1 TaxID=3038774 RepID=UPI0024174BC1|nr:phosphoribosylanthranilate isomerase [Hydrogenovibrio sp. 3SP14C1]MDG4813156.1 phosphoribosylanthranilate isomerase [Hydrogenovibrio sp. 3SP14C1]
MQTRTRVKICGITNITDAKAAVEAGADAIGFVFYEKSPRAVTIDQAWSIFQNLPAFVTTTALFVNPSAVLVQKVIEELKVDLLQFHGDESPAFCEQFSRPYIKAIRMQAETDLELLADQYASSQGLLLDTYVKGIPGGTGAAFNWDWVSPEKRQKMTLPVILAGGLSEENVGQGIESVHPWAVDVSGGVELTPGQKSSKKIQAFIQAVNDVR